jgi:hypothetical protein
MFEVVVAGPPLEHTYAHEYYITPEELRNNSREELLDAINPK